MTDCRQNPLPFGFHLNRHIWRGAVGGFQAYTCTHSPAGIGCLGSSELGGWEGLPVPPPPQLFLNHRKQRGHLCKGQGAQRGGGACFISLHSFEYLKPFKNVVLAPRPGKSWWHQGLAWGARDSGRAWRSLLGSSCTKRRHGGGSVAAWVQRPGAPPGQCPVFCLPPAQSHTKEAGVVLSNGRPGSGGSFRSSAASRVCFVLAWLPPERKCPSILTEFHL